MIYSFIKLLTRGYLLALPYGRLKILGVLSLIIFNGLLQLVGVTSIFPFFALAANPDRLRNSRFGNWFLHSLPPIDDNHLLVIAGCFSIIMLVIANIGSVASEVIRIRYAYGFWHWLRRRIFESYASHPYEFYLRRNSSDLNQKLMDVMIFIQNVFLPIGEILTRIVMVVLLAGAVFLVQPWVAVGAILVLGGFYFVVFLWLRPRARSIGEELLFHMKGVGKNTSQFLQGIKTVFVHGSSRFFIDKVLFHSSLFGRAQSMIPIYSNGPRYIIEPIAFGGLVAIVIVLALQGRPFSDILPNLSVMALAAYKLLPNLQMLYGQLVMVTANNYTLTQIEEEILELEKEIVPSYMTCESSIGLSFNRDIRIENLTFSYAKGVAPIIRDLSLTIRKNESVGIVGPSGSGKSTLVDLILGLHTAQLGQILIDEEPLTSANINSWRRMIGYVPQDIYLLDETIAENIAFGIPLQEIDQDSLKSAAEGAQILQFIQRELPQGFNTIVGERGMRLSGGQRQRIGIARALYNNPQVLILDEATSALDQETENAVMETINGFHGKLTMVTIAHRLTTIEKCDRIIRM
jgi:ATP-binding cassette subfamily C protein